MKPMDTRNFISIYQEAFGYSTQLPLLFGYSDQPVAATEKIGGVSSKGFRQPVREPLSVLVQMSSVAVEANSIPVSPTCRNVCPALCH